MDLDALPTPERASEASVEDAQEARRWLLRLPERERTAFALAAAGWSYAEIAARTGRPEGTVGTHLHRARRRLALTRAGG